MASTRERRYWTWRRDFSLLIHLLSPALVARWPLIVLAHLAMTQGSLLVRLWMNGSDSSIAFAEALVNSTVMPALRSTAAPFAARVFGSERAQMTRVMPE